MGLKCWVCWDQYLTMQLNWAESEGEILQEGAAEVVPYPWSWAAEDQVPR